MAASDTSRHGHRTARRLAFLEYASTLFGLAVAIFVTLGAGTNSTVAGFFIVLAMAGAFILALLLKLVARAANYERDWLQGRAIAEAVKGQSWRYMTRTAPYDTDDADDRFAVELTGLMRQARDIRQAVTRVRRHPQQISASMRELHAADLETRLNAYREQRLQKQADWYANKSGVLGFNATWRFWAAILLQFAAAMTAFLAVYLSSQATPPLGISQADVGPLMLRLMSLFASAAIAVTAWTLMARDDELSRAYADALQELSLDIDKAAGVNSENALAALVDQAEETIEHENMAWIAKRGERFESPDFGHAE